MKLAAKLLVVAALLGLGGRASAQGFQLERYEPNSSGAWFFAVQHPWYSSTRYFSAGVTLDYAHDPLLAGTRASGSFMTTQEIVEHALVGHLDLAASFLDRVQLSATLPVTLLERGSFSAPFDVGPIGRQAVGDPRFGAMVRLFGQPDRSGFSLHLAGDIWAPVGNQALHSGDDRARGLIQIIMAGYGASLRYAINLGFVIRGTSSFDPSGTAAGTHVGHALQAGVGLAYANKTYNFQIGPELLFDTVVANGHAFSQDYTSLDLLLGLQYNIAKQVLIGAAVGFGLVTEVGTPDYRAIFRLAYAPIREKKVVVILDRDHDGVLDDVDQCPDVPQGDHPDPARPGCPIGDRDKDGVLDDVDQCPDVAQGDHPDPAKPGCPIGDRDKDGITDDKDLCPDEPQGDKPDPDKLGCPLHDKDGDGISDEKDLCPDVPQGAKPDPNKLGCPLDTDGDGIPDETDACPTLPGVADPDPKKNGCPALKAGEHLVLRAVHFETNKATLVGDSTAVLDEIATGIKAHPEVKLLIVEGHTDDVGKAAHNLKLSRDRAKTVREYLIKQGIEATRLQAKGYGSTKPVMEGKSDEARAANRRVELRVPDEAKK
jgi:OmpA-OmpF porin, OOP family